MLFRGVRVAMAFRSMIGELADVMALAGAVEDQQTGRQRETGSAKEKSHNASHTKRRALAGARRISSLRVIPSEVEEPRRTSFDMQRGWKARPHRLRRLRYGSTSPGMTEQLGMKLKGLSVALL